LLYSKLQIKIAPQNCSSPAGNNLKTKIILRDSDYATSRLQSLANDLNQIIVQRHFVIVVLTAYGWCTCC